MGKRKDDEDEPTFWEKVEIATKSAKFTYMVYTALIVSSGTVVGYGTSDTVRSTVHGYFAADPLPVASGEVVAPVESVPDAWRAQVQQSLTSIIAKQKKHESRIEKAEAKSQTEDGNLQSQIDELKAWHE